MYVCTCTYISAWEGDHYLQAYRWKWFSRNPFGKTNSWTISPQKSFYGVREMEGEEWINRWSVSLCCTSVAPLQDKAGKRLWAFWVGMYAYMSSHVTDYWLQRFLFFDLLSICLLTFSKPFLLADADAVFLDAVYGVNVVAMLCISEWLCLNRWHVLSLYMWC